MVMWGRHASRAGLSASATASANVLSASFYHNRLLEPYAARASRKLALKTLLQFGEGMTERKLLQSANYVRLELPTRVAHRIRNMQKLPFVVGTNIHIMSVYEKLWGTFERLSKVKEVTSAEENSAFCDLLREITVDQENATLELALGMGKSHVYMGEEDVNLFMNTMIRSHISRRFLALQHIKLSEAPAGSVRPKQSIFYCFLTYFSYIFFSMIAWRVNWRNIAVDQGSRHCILLRIAGARAEPPDVRPRASDCH